MLRSDLCDFSDTYIVVKLTITLTRNAGRGFVDIRNRFLAFKNNAPFTNCISKFNNVLIDNAEDLDVVMRMHNLIEYSKNYRRTTGSLWNYYRDEPNNPLPNDDFLMCQEKAKNKRTKKLLRLAKIVITQLVIYWTMNIFQSIIN